MYAGSAMAARMAMIATTIISSIRVKPCWFFMVFPLKERLVVRTLALVRDPCPCRNAGGAQRRPRAGIHAGSMPTSGQPPGVFMLPAIAAEGAVIGHDRAVIGGTEVNVTQQVRK